MIVDNPEGRRGLNSRKKFFLWAGIVAIVCIFIWLFAILRSPQTTSSIGKSAQSPIYPDRGHNNTVQIISEKQVVSKNADVLEGKKLPSSNQPITQRTSRGADVSPKPIEGSRIESIIVEERLTFETKEGAELPPDEVPFRAGNTTAYLEGPSKVRLDFISPIGFKAQDDGRIVVINHFSLKNSSDLYWQPVENLKNFDVISLPVITALYGSSLATMVSFEVSLAVNGQDIWHYRLETKHPFYQNTTMRLDLGKTFKQQFDEK